MFKSVHTCVILESILKYIIPSVFNESVSNDDLRMRPIYVLNIGGEPTGVKLIHYSKPNTDP